MHTAADFSQYEGHPIRLEYEQASRDGVVYTDWVLFVDERMLYLGQDGRFVRQVLGQDFGAFIHEAFRRAGITTSSQSPRLAGDFAPDLLRASLARGVVEGLSERLRHRGRGLLRGAPGPRPLVAHRAVTEAGRPAGRTRRSWRRVGSVSVD